MGPDSLSLCRSRTSPPAPPPPRSGRRGGAGPRAAETLWSARSDDELVDVVGQVQQLSPQRWRRSRPGPWPRPTPATSPRRSCTTGRPGTGSPTWPVCVAVRASGGWPGPRPSWVRCRGPGRRWWPVSARPAQADVIVSAVEDLPPGDWTRRRGEKLMLRHAQSLDATELTKAGRHLVAGRRPRRPRPQPRSRAGTRGTRRPPGPVPVDHRGPGRWGPDPRPRHGRGRRPPHRSPPPPHPTPTRPRPSRRRPANLHQPATPATTAPASGTPWSPSPNTPSTPTCPPTPTAPPPDSWSPSTTRPCAPPSKPEEWAPPPTASTYPPTSSAGSPATPRSSPPCTAPAARSSTSAAPDAWSPPPCGPPS